MSDRIKHNRDATETAALVSRFIQTLAQARGMADRLAEITDAAAPGGTVGSEYNVEFGFSELTTETTGYDVLNGALTTVRSDPAILTLMQRINKY